MIEKLPQSTDGVFGVRLSGKLTHDDYQKTLIPMFDQAIEKSGKIRVLLDLAEDFRGWELHAAWDDFVFGLKHFNDFEKIALVGDKDWEEWMAKLAKPFTKADVKFFKRPETEEAWKWLAEG